MKNMFDLFFISINFGELELSNTTVFILLGLSIFSFLAVGISSLKLIQTAFSSSEED